MVRRGVVLCGASSVEAAVLAVVTSVWLSHTLSTYPVPPKVVPSTFCCRHARSLLATAARPRPHSCFSLA